MNSPNREERNILLVEDDPTTRSLLTDRLTQSGYTVYGAESLAEAMRIVDSNHIHIVCTDLMLTGSMQGGYELTRWLRQNPVTRHIPVLMMTVRADLHDKLEGFQVGIDDYVTKPFDSDEVIARLEALRRRSSLSAGNPLTQLPGARLVEEMIDFVLQSGRLWAAMYVDINHFKAFNDVHGFAEGDQVIQMLARVISMTVDTLGNPKDFVGHIGGDDFLVLTTPDKARDLCEAILAQFEERAMSFHTSDEKETRVIRAKDRRGVDQDFPLLSVAIGVVTSENRTFFNRMDLGKTLAEVKNTAKHQKGNSYFIDRRMDELSLAHTGHARILVVDDEASVREIVERSLQEIGFEVITAVDGVEALEKVHRDHPDMMIVDQLMPRMTGLEVLSRLRSDPAFRDLPVMMLTCMGGTGNIVRGLDTGADDYIVKPFMIPELQARIKSLMSRSHREDFTRKDTTE